VFYAAVPLCLEAASSRLMFPFVTFLPGLLSAAAEFEFSIT
jgi:hypothetical protein